MTKKHLVVNFGYHHAHVKTYSPHNPYLGCFLLRKVWRGCGKCCKIRHGSSFLKTATSCRRVRKKSTCFQIAKTEQPKTIARNNQLHLLFHIFLVKQNDDKQKQPASGMEGSRVLEANAQEAPIARVVLSLATATGDAAADGKGLRGEIH